MPRLVRMFQGLVVIGFMVSAALAWAGGGYVDNQDGTIYDPQHGTMWQRADDGVERSWQEAAKYCDSLEFAGYKDWALPKAYQLEGLIDTAFSPTIDPLFAVKASYYWSATDSTSSTDSAKYVNFFYGNTYTYSKDNPYYVLCVREATAIPGKGLAVVFAGAPVKEKPMVIRFTATITGGSEPYFYDWDFGDGSTSSAAKPTHEFVKDGQYKVLLTVSDNDGAIMVANQEIALPLAEIPAVGPSQDKTDNFLPEGKEKVPVLVEAVSETSEPPVNPLAEARLSVEPIPVLTISPPAEEGSVGLDSALPKIALVSRGTATIKGFVDVSACGQGMPYKEGALGHGLLAYSFANAMAGDGDWNKDGSVTSGEVQTYLDQAIKSLSKGQQAPLFFREGDDFALCASHGGSTYVLTIGIGHDLAGNALAAGQDSELVRKALEDKCQSTKTMMLTAEHANRQDILQSILQIGSMMTASDTLVVYVGAASGQDKGRLNWYVNDSQKELAAFTGIYHEDLLQLLKTLPMGYLMVLGEKN